MKNVVETNSTIMRRTMGLMIANGSLWRESHVVKRIKIGVRSKNKSKVEVVKCNGGAVMDADSGGESQKKRGKTSWNNLNRQKLYKKICSGRRSNAQDRTPMQPRWGWERQETHGSCMARPAHG